MLTNVEALGILFVVGTRPGTIAPQGDVLDWFHKLRRLGLLEWRTPNDDSMDHGWFLADTASGLDFLTDNE